MINLNSIQIGTMEVETMANFYRQVIGKKEDMVDSGWHGWLVGKTFLSIGEHSKMDGMAADPGRVMFNFETSEVQKEFERIRDLGATVVKEPYEMEGMWIATLADPDGNYFQLMSPWKE